MQNMGLEAIGGRETWSCDSERGAGLIVSCSLERHPCSLLRSAKIWPARPRASHLTYCIVVSLDCC